MKDERMQILRMLEEGKVSADEAFQLISALDEKTTLPSSKNKFLRIRVSEGGNKTKVNVNVPISLIRMAQRFIPKQVTEDFPELNLEEIISEIERGAEGKIVEVQDSDSDTSVEIIVE